MVVLALVFEISWAALVAAPRPRTVVAIGMTYDRALDSVKVSVLVAAGVGTGTAALWVRYRSKDSRVEPMAS